MDIKLMRSLRFATLIIILIAIIYSCDKKNLSGENDLKYKIVFYEKQSEGCDSLREDQCAKIKIEFPEITGYSNTLVQEKINQSIKSLFSMNENADVDSINFNDEMNSFIEDYDEYITEFPDAFQSWFVEKTGEVKLNKGNIFSIDYMEYSYTGGAHPNTVVEFRNYNLSNGEKITLDEVISPVHQKELTKIGEDEFRKLKELAVEADLGQAGFWFENNEFYFNDNFLITDSSLVFYYNNYEITAYAFGPTELIIPLSKIAPLVGDSSLIKPFLK
jgi:hypothetical protein